MLKVKIKNIEFSSPIIAASGTFGYGDEVSSFVDLTQIGCIITKSITSNCCLAHEGQETILTPLFLIPRLLSIS